MINNPKPSAFIVDKVLFYTLREAEEYVREQKMLQSGSSNLSGLPRHRFYIEALYTLENIEPSLTKKVKMNAKEFREWAKLYRIEDYWSLAERDLDLTGYKNLKERIFTGDLKTRVKNTNEFAALWGNYDPDNPEDSIELTPDEFTVDDGDLVISRGEFAADVHIVDGPADIDSEGKQTAVLLVNGIKDELYADLSEENPQGGDYGTMNDFYKKYRLLAKNSDLLKGDE